MGKILRKTADFIFLCVVIGGLAAVSYPSFSTYINQKFANNEIVEYQESMEDSSEERLAEMKNLADTYNAMLPITFPADPFNGTSVNHFEGTEFENFFMVQTGSMLGYVEIPAIDIYLPVYYGTTNEILSEGLGLLENTSLPVGGENTHAVISGHTGLASRKLFTDLVQMEEGNIFFIHVLNEHFAYQVDQIKVVWPYETDDLYIEEGKDYVTLLTCTPFGVNDHRLLVRGVRIDYDFTSEDTDRVNLQVATDKYLWMIVLGAAVLMIILTIVIRLAGRNGMKKRERSEP
ncbi:MAG: class C sortase [Lachnospiraceae bacterium]|nr:class C sortase [Lachnospiraceae bacterium]